jgi:hypothetical protein
VLPLPNRPRAEIEAASTQPGAQLAHRLYSAGDDMGLWRESEAFLRSLNGDAVFENSTACVYVETSRQALRLGEGLRQKTVDPLRRGDTLSSKLEGESVCVGSPTRPIFTESLILAQDERWRRA